MRYHDAMPRTWSEVQQLLASGNVKGKLAKDDLPTPALCVDLDALEGNIQMMATFAQAKGRALRPHGKSHKSCHIAHLTIAAGAVGACAAKISEAEAFADGGIESILVTTAMVGRYRIERAVQLAARISDLILVVEDPQNARDLNDAAAAAKVNLSVAIDLNVSYRTGVPTGAPAIALAELLDQLPHLTLKGLQAYAGHASHVVGYEARIAANRQAMAPAVETRFALEAKGIACPWLSGASTGTYNMDSEIDGITELQPGSYLFMDLDYNRIGGPTGPLYNDFANSLTVIATVNSRPSAQSAILDAGIKALATDRPFPPVLKDVDGVVYSFSGDEHGSLDTTHASRPLHLGERLEIVVPHCDPTVNLYNHMFATRGDQVEAIFPIDARGRTA